MASNSQRRDITSFFKPAAHSIPAKRPSPSFEEDDVQYITTKPKHSDLRTPQSTRRFKNATPSPYRSPIGSGPSSSVRIPIRSPKPKLSQEPVTSFLSRLSAHYKSSPVQKQKTDVASPHAFAQPFSFSDLPSSTQTVVKEGKVVVIKSSDDEDSASLSSLDDILGRRRSEIATSSSSPPELDADKREAERLRTILQFTNGRSQPLVGKDKLRELNSKERDHAVDIGSLMGDHFDDQEIEEKIARAKQGYEASKQDEERSRTERDVDKNLLAAVMAGGPGAPEDMSRLISAVERTEALDLPRHWSFLDPGGPENTAVETVEIAMDGRLSNWWQKTLEDDESRSRTFLSGYMGEAWFSGALPDEFIRWTFHNIIQEPQKELRRSYIQAFKDVKSEWVRRHVSSLTIEKLFLQIGASQQAVSCKDLIKPASHLSSHHEMPDCHYLLSLIELLTAMAPHLENPVRRKLLAIMARLTLDVHVMGDARVSVAVEDALSDLIELSTQEDDQAVARSFVGDFGNCLTDPTLQAQLLKHIPCTCSLAGRIRIHLAHRFLLGTDLSSETNLVSWSVDITTLTRYLDTGPFNTTFRSSSKRPDYANMTALTYLLDIAIADGDCPASFDSRAQEVAFNRKIDKLADRIKAIFASIADTGASHMRRTEAKEALQALYYRLLYAVRTEPRPKKNVFGGRDGEEYRAEQRSKGFMSKFLARKKDMKSSQGLNQESIHFDSSQASKSESEELIRRQLQLDG